MTDTQNHQPDWTKIAHELADALVQKRRNSHQPDQLTDEALEKYYSAVAGMAR